MTWALTLGAGEILMQEPVTAIESLPGDRLGIWSADAFAILNGTGCEGVSYG